MIYRLNCNQKFGEPKNSSLIATKNLIIVDTSENMGWLLGKDFRYLSDWVKKRNLQLDVISQHCSLREYENDKTNNG